MGINVMGKRRRLKYASAGKMISGVRTFPRPAKTPNVAMDTKTGDATRKNTMMALGTEQSKHKIVEITDKKYRNVAWLVRILTSFVRISSTVSAKRPSQA